MMHLMLIQVHPPRSVLHQISNIFGACGPLFVVGYGHITTHTEAVLRDPSTS